MKKIVALVLTLVLALSLATVAFGATGPVSLGQKYVKNTSNNTTVYGPYDVTFTKAVAPTVDPDTGLVTAGGKIAYYTVTDAGATFTNKYVEVATLAEADQVLYNDYACKVVFKYVKIIDTEDYMGNGVAFNDFGKACGQFKPTVKETATDKYYLFNETNVYVATEGTGNYLMVDGKRVEVAPFAGAWVDHVASYTYNDKFEVTAVKCGVCGKDAVIVPNYMSLPTGVTPDGALGDGRYYYFPAAAASTTGVTSAKTFDAGVALYAGMALMSVAGSAVVIGKKKEF